MGAAATHVNVPHERGHIRWRRWGGQGRPLVLLHGGHGSWLHWVRNIEALAERREVWVPDMPGYGDSAEVAGDSGEPGHQQRLVDVLAASIDRVLGPGTV